MRELEPRRLALSRPHIEQALRHLADELAVLAWREGEDPAQVPQLLACDDDSEAVARELSRVMAVSEGELWPVVTLHELGSGAAAVRSGSRWVLVCAVLGSGRGIHSACGQLLAAGAPHQVALAALVDRARCAVPWRLDACGTVLAGDERLAVQLDAGGRVAGLLLEAQPPATAGQGP